MLEVKDLNAVQWTPGAGKPDGGSEDWYPVYDMVKKGDKSLWVSIEDGSFDDWVEKADKLVKPMAQMVFIFYFPSWR